MRLIRSSSPVFLLALLALPGLAGCAASSGQYPSLAQREVERMVGRAEVAQPETAPPAPPAAPPADLPGRLAAIENNAQQAHARFLERVPLARSRAAGAAGAAIASERWAEAQIALAALESARSDTMFALADLDSMLATGAVAQAESGGNEGLPRIAALREQVAALVANEDAVLAELRARVG